MYDLPQLLYRTVCFLFNDAATTEVSPLSLHDALPISLPPHAGPAPRRAAALGRHDGSDGPIDESGAGVGPPARRRALAAGDRKRTRLKSSHANTSYAGFCLKKKKLYLARHRDEFHLYV